MRPEIQAGHISLTGTELTNKTMFFILSRRK